MAGLATAPVREGVTKAVRDRYIARIKNAQRAIGRLEEQGKKNIRRDLNSARGSIMAALFSATEFGQWHFPQVKAAIEEALSDFREQAAQTLGDHAQKAWDIGVDRVSSTAAVAGVDIVVPTFKFAVPKTHLEFAQGWAADLIQAESDDILKMISKDVRLSMAGGMTREQLIRRVQPRLTKALRFGTFRKRAEAIVRTETNRIYNASAQAARETLAADNVKVQKKWLSSGKGPGRARPNHADMDGQTVDVDKPFRMVGRDGVVYEPMYPNDPILPAAESVHCGCTTIEVFEVMDEDADDIAAGVAA